MVIKFWALKEINESNWHENKLKESESYFNFGLSR